MFFNLDADNGRSISGWIALDNPSVTPTVSIVIPGREDIVLKADQMRFDVRDLGIHSTGQVGFTVDTSIVPDLEDLDDIEIVETISRLPIYRRFQIERHLERRMFLFDASVMPQRRIMGNVARHFTLNYLSSERFPFETMLVLLSNQFTKSIFMSGRSSFGRYVSYLENNGFLRAAILRDPFEELAERLLFLSLLGKSNASNLIPTFVTGIEPLVGFARDLPFSDPKALLTAFRQTKDEERQALLSPMVKMLGCEPDELPQRRHVSKALDNLATMDVVGTRSRYAAFRAMIGQLIGADVLGADEPSSFQTVQMVAASLSRIGVVVDLLQHDLALYSYAEEAIAVGLDGRDDAPVRGTQVM